MLGIFFCLLKSLNVPAGTTKLPLHVSLPEAEVGFEMATPLKFEEPATYAGVAVLLGVVGLLASYLPSRRAASVHPALTLRGE